MALLTSEPWCTNVSVHGGAAKLCRHVQRCGTMICGSVHISTMVQQGLCTFSVTFLRRHKQRCEGTVLKNSTQFEYFMLSTFSNILRFPTLFQFSQYSQPMKKLFTIVAALSTLILAPWSCRASAISRWPFCAAMDKGVVPFLLALFTSAP